MSTKNDAKVSADGAAIILNCPCGLQHKIERDEKKKLVCYTSGEMKTEDELKYLFEDEEGN